MARTCLPSFLALTLLLACRVAYGAETPLAAIPDDASLVVRLKSPEATAKTVVDLVKAVDADLGRGLELARPALGLVISNPSLAGVDRKRDWWVAVFARTEQEPAIVFAIPATDKAAIREALPATFSVLDHDAWVVYSEDAAVLDRVKARLAGDGASLEKVLSGALLEQFNAGELSLFVNVPQLVATYRTQLDALVEQIHAGLNQLEDFSGAQQDVSLGPIVAMYRTMVEGALQALQDARGLAASVDFEDGGVSIGETLLAKEDSKTAAFLNRHAPSELKLVGQLPPGQVGYFGLAGYLEGLIAWGSQMEVKMYGGSAEAEKAVRELIAGYKELKLGDLASSLELGDFESGAVRGVTVTEIQPVEKLKELTRSTVTRIGNVDTPSLQQRTELKPAAESYGDYGADITHVTQKLADDGNPFGGQQMMELLFGAEGMTTRTIYMPDRVLQTLGGGRPLAERAVESLADEGKSAVTQPAWTATRNHLAERANLLVMIDGARLIADFLRLISVGGIPLPIDAQALERLELERSYTGVSVTTGNGSLAVKSWIPVEQAQNVARVIRAIQESQEANEDF
ncbi:MAG: hypothetical protein KY476_19395 [Planctomycetes bacterium]|nr:hypothetical protein [Planctomycetota bacterium]